MTSFTEILPGLIQWTAPTEHPQIPVCGYSLRDHDQIWLIDPPAGVRPETIRTAHGPSPVGGICITHLQAEHAGGVDAFPEVPVIFAREDQYLTRGAATYWSPPPLWPPPWDWEERGRDRGNVAGALNERPPAEPWPNPLRFYPEGAASSPFRVLSTPGHGKHAVTLLWDGPGGTVAFCGDLVCGDGQLWNWYDCDWDYGHQAGQRELQDSVDRLLGAGPLYLLCPAHGSVVREPEEVLRRLAGRLRAVLPRNKPGSAGSAPPSPINFPEVDGPAPGWRQITPHLFQYRTGNNIVLTNDHGKALMIDDGLCQWLPVKDRLREHDRVIDAFKRGAGIESIEVVVPTHFHGDHTEYLPHLAEREGARMVTLDRIAGPMTHPERYNLSCLLPWYGSVADTLSFDQLLEEGEIFHWGGYAIEFFHLGGQTGYHLGLNLEVDGEKTLIVGDAWWGKGGGSPPVLCWNDSPPRTRGWLYSARRIAEREPDLLVCGHGSAIRQPREAVAQAIARREAQARDFDALNPHLDEIPFFQPPTLIRSSPAATATPKVAPNPGYGSRG